MTSWYATLSSGSRSAEYTLLLKARPESGVFQIKHHATIDDSVSVSYKHDYKPYNKFSAKTDIEMRVDIITGAVTAAGFSAGFDLILVAD